MAGQEKEFIAAGEKYNVDPLFLVAIQYHESKYCRSYTSAVNAQRHNCAGIMAFSGGKRYLKEYPSYKEFIEDHARVIKTFYIDQGKETVNDIWHKYAPSNEKMNNSWGPSIAKKYNDLLDS